MKIVSLVTLACCFITGTLYAAGETFESGKWPKDWPRELEPLRKQSKTMIGGVALLSRHEIRFTSREQFEAAWPHLLKVKSTGAPIVLFRGPSEEFRCEVRVQCPPSGASKTQAPVKPIVSAKDTRTRWLKATYIELYVDGQIVDLNRIELPTDAPVIDKRFGRQGPKASVRVGGASITKPAASVTASGGATKVPNAATIAPPSSKQ